MHIKWILKRKVFAKHALSKGFRFRMFTSHILPVNLYAEYIKIS